MSTGPDAGPNTEHAAWRWAQPSSGVNRNEMLLMQYR
jgi:hypothetical protein